MTRKNGRKKDLKNPSGEGSLVGKIGGAVIGASEMASVKYSRRRIMGSEQEYGVMGNWFIRDGPFLSNGSLLRIDCMHPEYASAEASNPLDAVIYDKAGERIVQTKIKGVGVRLFKNNRDLEGNSFASHESYSLNRRSFNSIISATLPFFTSRIIFAGSGFINNWGKYELSQKAGVTREEVCERTIGDAKGIFNLRNEPLANPSKYMRLHVVSGDGNMSEPALFLKFGTTGLVLDLLEDGRLKPTNLEDAVGAFHDISKDLSFKNRYVVREKGEMTAVEIQRVYQEAAEKSYRGRDEMTDDILDRWKFVLDSLDENPMVLDRWMDWAIKKRLIDSYIEKTGKSLRNTSVRNIDLQYHEVNREKGLFYKLQDSEMVDRLVTDEQIEHAVENPPQDTRARFRGLFSKSDLKQKWISWESVSYRLEEGRKVEESNTIERRYCEGVYSVLIKLDDPLRDYRELDGIFEKNG